jgi:DNA-binding XRE family transcriptional regulator
MNLHKQYTIRLKAMRAFANMTQAQLARKVGVSTQSISNIESGRHVPRGSTLHKMLLALNANEQEIKDIKEVFGALRAANK